MPSSSDGLSSKKLSTETVACLLAEMVGSKLKRDIVCAGLLLADSDQQASLPLCVC